MIKLFLKSDDGQSLVEYSLILSLIAIATIGVVFLYGKNLNNLFIKIKNTILENSGEQ